jgi:hypothetical protein
LFSFIHIRGDRAVVVWRMVGRVTYGLDRRRARSQIRQADRAAMVAKTARKIPMPTTPDLPLEPSGAPPEGRRPKPSAAKSRGAKTTGLVRVQRPVSPSMA